MKTKNSIAKSPVVAVAVVTFFTLFAISAYPADVNINKILSGLTLKEKVGQLLMVNVLENPDGSPSDRMKKLIQRLNIGSVIFYDISGSRAGARYTNQLQEWADASPSGLPLLVGSDMEYGPRTNVSSGATTFPTQMGIGATGNPELAERAAAITAREARSMGINWNFAPVADVNSNPENPVIGVRSFGSNPGKVSTFIRAAVTGYQENNMIATLKHYPGHGDTETDSHYGLPKVSYGETELESHLRPFKEGIAAGADAVMTAHIIVETIDPELPATMSEKVIKDLLRNRQGFDGVVITDSMNMGAIENNFGKVEGAVKAIKAGVDVVMAVGTYSDAVQIHNGLVEAVRDGEIPVSSVNESVERVLELKEDYGLMDGDNLTEPAGAAYISGSPGHEKVSRTIAEKAVTLVKDERNLVPLDDRSEVLLAGVKDSVY
ncbi:MAG: glycoside hydrolase family 3 protein, partial [Candidatus Bipolaricaulota bacterium]